MPEGENRVVPMEALSLHRYYIWANKMRENFDSIVSTKKDIKPEDFADELGLYMSYWYGGLYVVIEGWQDIKLSDEKIDSLLKSDNVELLRRYRNGAFHYQKNYFDDRFFDLFLKGQEVIKWIRQLNLEFGRFFLTYRSAH